ncbi:hypothetical protein F5X68DRAFT_72864 [Plectosphaerella plurivora]|uniref:Uncharacterized protein n=1 Tax=Plectosphaerella plurivora TaxID=936078 RepID=A0A9P9A9R6_9PEZI|nr:hypothetical protein F5X68DRAFT_72864 [Plectosphaerella plurivora]
MYRLSRLHNFSTTSGAAPRRHSIHPPALYAHAAGQVQGVKNACHPPAARTPACLAQAIHLSPRCEQKAKAGLLPSAITLPPLYLIIPPSTLITWHPPQAGVSAPSYMAAFTRAPPGSHRLGRHLPAFTRTGRRFTRPSEMLPLAAHHSRRRRQQQAQALPRLRCQWRHRPLLGCRMRTGKQKRNGCACQPAPGLVGQGPPASVCPVGADRCHLPSLVGTAVVIPNKFVHFVSIAADDPNLGASSPHVTTTNNLNLHPRSPLLDQHA